MRRKVRETVVLGGDLAEDLQETAVSVCAMKYKNGQRMLECIKVFYGEEAISLYDALTSPSTDGGQL